MCNQTGESDQREKMLALREKLLQAEKARAAGDKGNLTSSLERSLKRFAAVDSYR